MTEILIKNMEMPKGGTLTLVVHPNGDVYLGDVLKDVKIGKAIELPPHGELVERSWLRGEIGNVFLDVGGFLNPNSEMYSPLVSKICDAVVNAPTVLEAST